MSSNQNHELMSTQRTSFNSSHATVCRFLLVFSIFLFGSSTIFGQNETVEGEKKFNTQSFYALSDWAFYKAVCEVNDPNYRALYEWSLDTGPKIMVIKRLDSVLTKINDGMMSRNYAFFSSGFEEIKTFEDKLELDDVKKQQVRRHLNYQMDSLYVVGVKFLLSKCNLGFGFGKDENYKQYLSYVRDYNNLQRMYITFDRYRNEVDISQEQSRHISSFELSEQLQAIADRVHDVEEQDFALYRTYSASPQNFKAFNMNHGNDFLAVPFVQNQDQEMTGNFRFEVSTDQFKARWIKLNWLLSGVIGKKKNAVYREHNLKNPKYSMLSYQNISLGGDGFTPYIRYLNNTTLADTMHQFDRPFGSYVYLERRKFRLWPKGLVRQNGTFQIGRIGLMAGQFLQAQLHKDAVTESQKVYGWDKQVGNGGRWLIQFEQDWDVLLFSNTNKYRSIFALNSPKELKSRPTRNRAMQGAFKNLKKPYAGINVIANFNAQYGGYLTALTTGITFSTLDFLHQSGHITVRNRRNNQFNFGWHLEAGVKYRNVVHNTMLEGLGYTKTFPSDDYDDENSSIYTLSKGSINRNLWLVDFKAVLQWRKMTFYYQLNLNRIEYSLPKVDLYSPEIMAIVNNHTATEDPEFYDYFVKTIRPEVERSQNRKFYGYGVIGMTWVIE